MFEGAIHCNALYLSYSIWSRWTLNMFLRNRCRNCVLPYKKNARCCTAWLRCGESSMRIPLGTRLTAPIKPTLREWWKITPLKRKPWKAPTTGKVPSMPCMSMYGRSMPCGWFFSWTGAYKLFFLIKPLSIASSNHLEASSVLTQRMNFWFEHSSMSSFELRLIWPEHCNHSLQLSTDLWR